MSVENNAFVLSATGKDGSNKRCKRVLVQEGLILFFVEVKLVSYETVKLICTYQLIESRKITSDEKRFKRLSPLKPLELIK
jgi:hypothetical protein